MPRSDGPTALPPSWHAAQVAFVNATRPRAASPFAHSTPARRLPHAGASKPSLALSGFSVAGSCFTTHADHAFASAPIFSPLYF